MIQANIENAADVTLKFLNNVINGDRKRESVAGEGIRYAQRQQYLIHEIKEMIKERLANRDKKHVSGIPSNKSVAWLFDR